jgi:hypothetical protein
VACDDDAAIHLGWLCGMELAVSAHTDPHWHCAFDAEDTWLALCRDIIATYSGCAEEVAYSWRSLSTIASMTRRLLCRVLPGRLEVKWTRSVKNRCSS